MQNYLKKFIYCKQQTKTCSTTILFKHKEKKKNRQNKQKNSRNLVKTRKMKYYRPYATITDMHMEEQTSFLVYVGENKNGIGN